MDTCTNLNFTEIIYSSYKSVENISDSCEVYYEDAAEFCETNYASCDWRETLKSQLFVEPLKCLYSSYLTKKCLLIVISIISTLGVCLNVSTLTT